MPSRPLKRYRIIVNRVNDIIGADLVKDAIRIIITEQLQTLSVQDAQAEDSLKAIAGNVDKPLSQIDEDITGPLAGIRSILSTNFNTSLTSLQNTLMGTGGVSLTDLNSTVNSVLNRLNTFKLDGRDYLVINARKDRLELDDHTSVLDEIILSGDTFAFNVYNVGNGLYTRVDGTLIANEIGGDGTIFGEGVIEPFI